MSVKKEKTPKEKVWKEFLADLNDTELQDRYDRFREDEKRDVDSYNRMVDTINELHAKKATLEGIIVDSAILEISAHSAVELLKTVRNSIEELGQTMAELASKIAENQKLIKQYKNSSENNLYVYWKMLNAVDETVGPYHEFSQKYKDRIF